jgi:hypothetical protein
MRPDGSDVREPRKDDLLRSWLRAAGDSRQL